MSVLLPTDNAWDIPSLRLDMQATEIPTPVLPWGALRRDTRMQGTWHFFEDDYRFGRVLKRPDQVARTGCAAAVEPNITLHEMTPRWEVIHAIGRKRSCARAWQDAGIRILVDMNVPRRHRDLCMHGVPRGWRAFATRGYARRLDDLVTEHDFACSWAGGPPIVVVVGGGPSVETLCRELVGCIYVPSFHDDRRVATKRTNTTPGVQA